MLNKCEQICKTPSMYHIRVEGAKNEHHWCVTQVGASPIRPTCYAPTTRQPVFEILILALN